MVKKVILIDDDIAIQDAIKLVLERAGYEVILYPDGNAVLRNECTLPDIFILDKQLSGVSGLDICSFLKNQEHTCHIPVIILSASPNIAALAKKSGANAFLEKPFDIKRLRALVEKHT